MTTIAWDGKVLAVDSRSSTPEQRPDTDTEPRRARICFHCERPAWTGSDDAHKLVILPKVTWRGEKILAAAGTGSSRDCERLRQVMSYPPEPETELEKIWKNYVALAPRRGPSGTMRELLDVTLVVVTEKHLWVLDFLGTSLRSYLEPRDMVFAKGSGRDAAMLAMTVMGATAAQAVWAARAIDPATGGAVHWMDTTQRLEEGKRTSTLDHEEPAMTREEAAAYVRSGFTVRPVKPEIVGVVDSSAVKEEVALTDSAGTRRPAAPKQISTKKVVKKVVAKKTPSRTTTKK